jgi:formylglycine-generating enzyme required for sulfatase activity
MVDIGRDPGESSIKIGRYVVTNLEFARFIADGGYREEKFWHEHPHAWKWRVGNSIQYPAFWDHIEFNKPNYPVVGLSVYEAIAYCKWLTEKVTRIEEASGGRKCYFHLPTEEQWALAEGKQFAGLTLSIRAQLEKMIRQNPPGSVTSISYQQLQEARDYADTQSKEISLINAIWWELGRDHESLMSGPSMPVGLFAKNEKGCFDMFGHIWQWCDDWAPIVDENPLKVTDRRPSTTKRESSLPVIVKGGPILDHADGPSNAITGWFDPYTRFHRIGFRVCCTIVSRLEE